MLDMMACVVRDLLFGVLDRNGRGNTAPIFFLRHGFATLFSGPFPVILWPRFFHLIPTLAINSHALRLRNRSGAPEAGKKKATLLEWPCD